MEQLDTTWHTVHIINEEEPFFFFFTDDPGAPCWFLHVLPNQTDRAMEATEKPNVFGVFLYVPIIFV